MAHYFVDNIADAEGSHHVHAAGCAKLPVDKRYLGNFYNVDEAMMEARKEFWQLKGCRKCAHGDMAATDTVRALRIGARVFA